MNKRQTKIAWAMGLILFIALIKAYNPPEITSLALIGGEKKPAFNVVQLLLISVPTLILGGVSIYILRDKQK